VFFEEIAIDLDICQFGPDFILRRRFVEVVNFSKGQSQKKRGVGGNNKLAMIKARGIFDEAS